MKGRLIKDNKDLLFLDENGMIREVTNDLLYKLLFSFKNLKLDDACIGYWNKELPDMAAYEGTTLCYITDSNQLIISDAEPFQELFASSELKIDECYTVKEFAELHNKSTARIKKMCIDGILKAQKINNVWFIAKQPYPNDRRVKNGSYIKD